MIFSEIKPVFEGDNQPNYSFEGDSSYLSNLSKINVFVGSNNSGKSKLLRELFAGNGVLYKLFHFSKKETEDAVERFNQSLSKLPFHDQMLIHLKNGNRRFPPIEEWLNGKSDFSQYSGWVEGVRQDLRFSNTANSIHLLDTLGTELNQITDVSKSIQANLSTCYIPVLRGLRPINFSQGEKVVFTDSYAKRTNRDYVWQPDDKKHFIFTGLALYNVVRDHLLGDQTKRKKIKDFEDFLKEHFFWGKEISLVPRHDSDVLYINIGGDERPIYDLGDGIQSIIILTYPLFFYQDQYMAFFFEEPETHLHPGLQRVFIDALLRPEFSKFQYFFTTHSNHFLDLTLEYDNISIYSFEKGEKDGKSVFNVKNVNHGDTSVLGLLGVRNSSVFLSNCTIWVEGITDRLYIRKYLELYQKEIGGKVYKEDLHFSFVEYGGGNITHWSFLEDQDEDHKNIDVTKLCSTLMLIADSDNATGKKKDRHEQLRKVLGDRFVLLEVTEIENLLTKPVIMKTIQQYCPKDSIDFQKFEKGTYEKKKLGTYIDATLNGVGRTFAADSGTINDKVNFCKRAISNINSNEDISQAAKDLARKIFEFIKSKNN